MKALNVLKKSLAALTAAVLLCCCTACKDTSWVLRAGNDTISAGVYLGYMIESYYAAATSVSDKSADLFSQKIDGVAAADYIRKQTLDEAKQHLAADRLFAEYELSLSDEDKAAVQSSLDSVWSSISKLYEQNGCGKTSYLGILTAGKRRNNVFAYYYGKDGKEPVAESDLKAFFADNYAKYKVIDLQYSAHYSGVNTATDASSEQKTRLKELAESYVKRLKEGADIDRLIAEEKAFGNSDKTAAEVKEVDPSFIQKDTSDSPNAVNAAIFAAENGVPTLIENSAYGYYVIVRYPLDRDGKDFTDRASSILSAMKNSDFEKVLLKTAEEMKITENNQALRRYKPQKINFTVG